MSNQNKQPRPHAELIKAWADGAQIQYFSPVYGEWADNDNPTWSEAIKYRIKPEGEKVLAYGLILSEGETALIRAIRKTDVSYVWEHKGALLIDKADFTPHGDFIAFLTAGDEATDDKIREALNAISREQEQEAISDE